MLVRLSSLLLFCIASFLFLPACDDKPATPPVSVLGRWELAKGFRNKKETETLTGVYFNFDGNGKMQTNLPVGSENPTDYELKKNEIRQKSPQPVTYMILSASDSTLVLALEIRGMPFELHLKKAALPPVEAIPYDSLSQSSDTLSE